MYEAAAVFHRPPHVLPPESGTLIQYVADIADINVNTLDGNNTLNGYYSNCYSKTFSLLEEPMPRIKEAFALKSFAERDFKAKAHVPIQTYTTNGVVGYSKINVKDFVYGTKTVSFLKKVNVVWFYGKMSL